MVREKDKHKNRDTETLYTKTVELDGCHDIVEGPPLPMENEVIDAFTENLYETWRNVSVE